MIVLIHFNKKKVCLLFIDKGQGKEEAKSVNRIK